MKEHYFEELQRNLDFYEEEFLLQGKTLFLFGHCEANLTIVDELIERGHIPTAILDNNPQKQGLLYKQIPVCTPAKVMETDTIESVVLIATRFYEEMHAQLSSLGFKGRIFKVVDFNTYAEYSLSEDTINRKKIRAERGKILLDEIKIQYPNVFIVFCPFDALGDIYFCASYLSLFFEKRKIDKAVMCVSGDSCKMVANLFRDNRVIEIYSYEQSELDSMIQASLFYNDEMAFVAHQDRPYVVNLHNALHSKCIPLDIIYRCGVLGLDISVKPAIPKNWSKYPELIRIEKGNAVVLSPYAKSVIALPKTFWTNLAGKLLNLGYQVFTNVVGDEKAIEGTISISPGIAELKSVVERAGTFIGIRSGLCDVIRTADCRKIAIFPDYYYGDTRWKAIEIYRLDEFENYVYESDEAILEIL